MPVDGSETANKYIRLLLGNRRNLGLILASALLCGLVAAGITLTLPKKYQARATLVVSPAPYKTRLIQEGEQDEIANLMPKALHVEDLKSLFLSDGVRGMLLQQLTKDGKLPEAELEELAKPRQLQRALDVETKVISQSSNFGDQYSKVLNLVGKAKSPESAVIIAQTWCQVSLATVDEYLKGTKQASLTYLTTEFESVTGELTKAEDGHQEAADKYDEELTTYGKETADLTAKQQDETDNTVRDFEDETDQSLRMYNDETDALVKAVEDDWEQNLSKLRSELKVELADQEMGIAQRIIVEYESERIGLKKKGLELQRRLDELNLEIGKHPQFLVLAKAMTDDALWERLSLDPATGRLPADLEKVKLRDEQINPLHVDLLTKIADTGVQLRTLPDVEAFLAKEIEGTKVEHAGLFNALEQKKYQLGEFERQHVMARTALDRQREFGAKALERSRTTELSILKRSRETDLAKLKLERTKEERKLTRESELMTQRLLRSVTQNRRKYDALYTNYLSAKLAAADQTPDVYAVGGKAVMAQEMNRYAVVGFGAALFLGALLAMACIVLQDLLAAGAAGPAPQKVALNRKNGQ